MSANDGSSPQGAQIDMVSIAISLGEVKTQIQHQTGDISRIADTVDKVAEQFASMRDQFGGVKAEVASMQATQAGLINRIAALEDQGKNRASVYIAGGALLLALITLVVSIGEKLAS